MGRIRTIKPEFFTSPDTEHASMEARLLFIAMWCWADDYGIGETNLLGLRAFAFPEEDPHLRKELPSLCKEVAEAYGVRFYKVGRRAYYQILTWDTHQKTQRRAKDKNPHYDDPEAQVDERFHNRIGTSEHKQGSSEQTLGNSSREREREREREQGKGSITPPDASRRPATQTDTFPPISRLKKTNGRYEYPTPFVEWWRTYPKHKNGSMSDAYTAWQKAVKDIDPADLLRLTAAFASNPGVDDMTFVLDADRWLKRRKWETVNETDQAIAPPTSSSSGYTPDEWLREPPPEEPGDIIDGEVITAWELEA